MRNRCLHNQIPNNLGVFVNSSTVILNIPIKICVLSFGQFNNLWKLVSQLIRQADAKDRSPYAVVLDQGSQHFKKTKFPDFSLTKSQNFNSFPVSHVFYVVAVNYLQYKTPVPHHGVKGEAALEARGATPFWLFSVHNHV